MVGLRVRAQLGLEWAAGSVDVQLQLRSSKTFFLAVRKDKPFARIQSMALSDFNPMDALISQNGWNLPCFGPGCVFWGAGVTTERNQEITEVREAWQSLTVLVRTSSSDEEAKQNLAHRWKLPLRCSNPM
jgi:hypothetical protein